MQQEVMSFCHKGRAAAKRHSLFACRNKVNTGTDWTEDSGHWTSWATQFFPFPWKQILELV